MAGQTGESTVELTEEQQQELVELQRRWGLVCNYCFSGHPVSLEPMVEGDLPEAAHAGRDFVAGRVVATWNPVLPDQCPACGAKGSYLTLAEEALERSGMPYCQ